MAQAAIVIAILILVVLVLKQLAEVTERAGKSILQFIKTTVLLVVFVLGFESPGMITMYIWHERVMPQLDMVQLWTFATVVSVVSYLLFSVALFQQRSKELSVAPEVGDSDTNPWAIALAAHASIFLAIVVVLLVAKFGFKADFPLRFIQTYFWPS